MRLALVILMFSTSVATANPEHEPRSEGTAIMLSLGITTLSWGALGAARTPEVSGIALLGTLLGPMTGHWYAGRIVTWGLGLRVIGAAATLVGLAAALEQSDCHDACGESQEVILIPIGLLAYAGGTIGDLITAHRAAREYNERHRRVSIVPLVQSGTAGVGLAGRF